MKIVGIVSIFFGLFLIALAIGIFQSLPTAKADDIIFYIFGMIFSGFSGLCLVLAGINDYNKSRKDEK
jgi:energy-converting hydrogenase Eha subunit G